MKLVEELHELLLKQKIATSRERIQALYLLKMGQVKMIQDVAVVLGRERVTIQRWLRIYTESGITGLLSTKKSTGRPPIINASTREQFSRELEQPEGFKSYEEIRTCLKAINCCFVSGFS